MDMSLMVEDVTEWGASHSKRPQIESRYDETQAKDEGPAAEFFQDQAVAAPKNESKVPDRNTPQPQWSTSERPMIQRRNEENVPDQGRAEGREEEVEEGLVQDQIIIAPEIMRKVLEELDVRNLKRVRLVCKSWLLEAQAHLETRGRVWLCGTSGSFTRTLEFVETRKNKIRALPQPFSSVEVGFNNWEVGSANWGIDHLNQLSNLCTLVVITKFTTTDLPLRLALPLIIQCSSSLEYLQLRARDSVEGYRIPRREDANLKFPKLQGLDVDASLTQSIDSPSLNQDRFSLLVAWIMRVSPNIHAFRISADDFKGPPFGLANETLREVDLRAVTTLRLGGIALDNETVQHFSSSTVTFSKLENLSIDMIRRQGLPPVFLSILIKAAPSLRTLVLNAKIIHQVEAEFPVCPNVWRLKLVSFPSRKELVARCFPSLQHLELSSISDGFQSAELVLKTISRHPFASVKTFLLPFILYSPGGPQPTTLFTAFPALESLGINASFLFAYSRVKSSSGGAQSFDLLKSLKYLDLEGLGYEEPDSPGYSWLIKLKGIETLTLSWFSLSQVMKIPAAEMSSLKLLRFGWVEWPQDFSDLEKLLKFVKGVKRVEITNCCQVLRKRETRDLRSKELLETFFDAAPNAGCGCK